MAETVAESREPDRAKLIKFPPWRPDGTSRTKPLTGAQRRATAKHKTRRAARRRAGKDRYE